MPADAERTDTALDAAALARLRELDPDGSRGVLPRILAVYETSLLRSLVQLQAAQGAGRAQLVCDMAHTLKSSSASVGAAELSALCAAIEQRLRPQLQAPSAPTPMLAPTDTDTNTNTQLDEDSDRLLAHMKSTLSMVRSMLADAPAAARPTS